MRMVRMVAGLLSGIRMLVISGEWCLELIGWRRWWGWWQWWKMVLDGGSWWQWWRGENKAAEVLSSMLWTRDKGNRLVESLQTVLLIHCRQKMVVFSKCGWQIIVISSLRLSFVITGICQTYPINCLLKIYCPTFNSFKYWLQPWPPFWFLDWFDQNWIEVVSSICRLLALSSNCFN